MSSRITGASFAGVAVALAVLASPLTGQDCGRDCSVCGSNWWEGITFSPTGDHDMECQVTETGSCGECGRRSVNAAVIDAALIARTIQDATPQDIPAVIAAYGRRLLVQTRRGLVAVRGTGCSEDAVAAVIFVGTTAADSFRRLGVSELSDTAH